jgi:hypothetical protein
MLRNVLHELGEKAHLNPETLGMTSTTVCFLKDPSVGPCAGSHWLTLKRFKYKYFQKYHHQERLDHVSSKNNVVL